VATRYRSRVPSCFDVIFKNFFRRLGAFGLIMSCVGCGQPIPAATNTFVLRGHQDDVEAISNQVVQALASTLRDEERLKAPYPQVGSLTIEPDPSQANVQNMSCSLSQPQISHEGGCILLNQAGDFIRVQPITWQSQAFFQYRIYVSPKLFFVHVNLAEDFVAIDAYLMQDPNLWDVVDRSVRAASSELGARPFQP
jgi:hypothetical protein